MRATTWPCPDSGDEYALIADAGRRVRLLVIPPLFDEANKTRHFLVQVLRRLDRLGVDCLLPDLAGCNESLAPLAKQTVWGWRAQVSAAIAHFEATHVLAVRGGAMLDPGSVPAIHYAPLSGPRLLRGLLRSMALSEREAGRESRVDDLLARGREEGLLVAGHEIGALFVRELGDAVPPKPDLAVIEQAALGGGGMWLRAEPGHDETQATQLARIVFGHLGS